MTATDLSENDTTQTETPDKGSETRLAAWIIAAVLVVLAGWAASIAAWGVVGLYIPALALVPVIWIVLLLLVRG